MSKTALIEQTTTLGGRITCRRCQVMSSNGLQCRRGAMKNQAVCHGHSELPKGPKTPGGRQRCAEAKTIHGFETRQARTERALGMRRLRELEDLGHLLGIMTGLQDAGAKTDWLVIHFALIADSIKEPPDKDPYSQRGDCQSLHQRHSL